MTAVPNGTREQLGEARFGLAKALWPDRRAKARALELARGAVEDFTAAGPAYSSQLAEAQAWLRERGA